MGAIDAARAGLIEPVLIGPKERMAEIAPSENVELGAFQVVDIDDPVAAAIHATSLVRSGAVKALMKGSLHTDELMGVVVSKEAGLRTPRRISHVFVMDVPSYDRLLLMTDCAVNIAPELKVKRDIVQNAIEVAHVLGRARKWRSFPPWRPSIRIFHRP